MSAAIAWLTFGFVGLVDFWIWHRQRKRLVKLVEVVGGAAGIFDFAVRTRTLPDPVVREWRAEAERALGFRIAGAPGPSNDNARLN